MEENDKKLNDLVDSVVNTLKFQGVYICKFNIGNRGVPTFFVKVNTSEISKSLKEVLDFTYWTLWTLIYGKYEKGRKEEIVLKYKEVKN